MLGLVFIIIGAVILLLLIISFGYFNRFTVLQNRIKNAFAQIDVQLKKRADLVPNLVESVRGYMRHEREIFEKIAEARKALIAVPQGDMVRKIKAGDVLQNALSKVFAIAENYPDLKANQNFLQLQNELSAIEDKVAYARQFYNDSVLSYNNTCTTIPGMWFAAIFGKKADKFLEIPQAQREAPKVKF